MEQLPLFQSPPLSVSDLTAYLRDLMESDETLSDVWVMGEISNFSRPASGHVYFTLKDERAALRCVIWRTSFTRIKVALENGMAVEMHGHISLYERDGQYQLYVDAVRPAGAGFLFQEFLRLKARLEAEGLFSEERKRPIPEQPKRIGIVTSTTGAALQDMLRTLRKRYPVVEVIIASTSVQGEEAPREIIQALQKLNLYAKPDVIVVARGGGSLEDLWAFNDEGVVRAIAASEAPVITGIGHETDFTLADFAADLRAPTPTAAAVAATPDIEEIKTVLGHRFTELNLAFSLCLAAKRSQSGNIEQHLHQVSPQRRIQNDRQRLDDLIDRAGRALVYSIKLNRAQWKGLHSRLQALNPLAVLKRGFAIVQKPDGSLVTSVQQIVIGQQILVKLVDGHLFAKVEEISTASDQE